MILEKSKIVISFKLDIMFFTIGYVTDIFIFNDVPYSK